MKLRKLAGAVALAGLLPSGVAHAVGLGQLSLDSYLNQPLDAEIKLINVGELSESQIFVRLGSQEDFELAGVEREYLLTRLRFDVDLEKGVVHVSTRQPIREPYLNFVLETRWPNGRVLREYTVLLDLPVVEGKVARAAPSRTTVTETAPTETRRVVPAPKRPKPDLPPVPAGSYRTEIGDTLWTVARRLRPDADANKTMLALQAANPEAFYRNNINNLKAGYVFRVPSTRDIESMYTDSEARAVVQEQMRAWREGRSLPAPEPRAAAADAAPAPVESARPEAPTHAAGKETADKEGHLELSTGGQADTGGAAPADSEADGMGGASQAELDAAQEALDAAERENADLQGRLTEMEDQVKTLRRLVELKDEQLSQLQTGEGDAPAPAAAPAESAPESRGPSLSSIVLAVVGVALAVFAIVLLLIQRRKSTATAEPALAAAGPSPAPAEAVAETEAVDTTGDTQEVESDVFDVAEEVSESEESTAETAEAPAMEAEEAPTDTGEEEAVTEEPETPVEAQTDDVIGEADIYMSLGRHGQAVGMIKSALEKEPDNTELTLKLLEVYVAAGDKDGFREEYEKLQEAGDAQAVGRAKELLLSVDDAGEWLGEKRADTGTETVTDFDMDLSDSEGGAGEDDTVVGDALTDDDFGLDASAGETSEAAEETPSEEDTYGVGTTEIGVEEISEGETDFDLGSFGAEEAEAEAEEETLDLGGDEDLDFLSETDEVGTKLDLAKAYIDMGDSDGAREILEEVLEEGDEEAKTEARKLLEQL